MNEGIDEAAARWHLAQARDDCDWDVFTRWLEADPRHARAYDQIALLDERIDRAAPVLAELTLDLPAVARVKQWGIAALGAVAAVLAMAVGVDWSMRTAPTPLPAREWRTNSSGPLRVEVASGVVATLGPGSVMRRSASAALRIEGSAYFDIRHDPARPLSIAVGRYIVRDVGTRFEVSNGGGFARVAVVEGNVAVSAAGAAGSALIGAGQSLLMQEAGPGILRNVEPEAVAGWRSGRLAYDGVPLALVAADVSRYAGRRVTVDPAQRARLFSGVIATRDRDTMIGTLAELTGLHARPEEQGVRLGTGR